MGLRHKARAKIGANWDGVRAKARTKAWVGTMAKASIGTIQID